MRPHPRTLTLALAAAAACSSETLQPELDDAAVAALEITVPKAAYTHAELDVGSGPGLRARIVNQTGQAYYSRLGDAFNGAVEQDPVWVANGSDGALQRADGASWVAVDGVFLIEGIREVRLGAGKSYELIAHTPASAPAGRYRVVVSYRSAPGGAVTGRAASAAFEVR
jgi:hypothetical protein